VEDSERRDEIREKEQMSGTLKGLENLQLDNSFPNN
jgi:hypothetical protein